jgi:hypothetical protein
MLRSFLLSGVFWLLARMPNTRALGMMIIDARITTEMVFD